MSNVFFTSDTHYHHKNIVRGTSEWDIAAGGSHQQLRDFDTLEEHNTKLVDNFNKLVKENDILYHLGDWSFGGIDKIWEFRKQLSCKNIHLILGNHDHHIEANKQLPVSQQGDHLSYKMATMHDLFSSVQHYKEVSVDGQRIVLCHFAMRVWNKSHKGAWMLYGHSHGTLDEMIPQFANPTWIGDQYYVKNYRTMDVGVDTNNLMPYSFEDVRNLMKNKDVLMEVDHHNQNTN